MSETRTLTLRDLWIGMVGAALMGFGVGGVVIGIHADVYAYHRGFKDATGCDLGSLEPACVPVYERMEKENAARKAARKLTGGQQ